MPTIWLDGVTSGGYPEALRTFGTSARTSRSLSPAPCCLSWDSMLEIIPPGIWLSKMSVSTVKALMNWAYLGLTVAKWSRTLRSSALSRSAA